MDGLTMLVVADGLAVAQDLSLALRRHASVTVLGPAFDEHAAKEALAEGGVDVVVVDLDRADDLGLHLVWALRATALVPVVRPRVSSMRRRLRASWRSAAPDCCLATASRQVDRDPPLGGRR